MKKICYNNWIAKTFLSGFQTITLAAWILTKCDNKEDLGQIDINHECVHVKQWIECMVLSFILIFVLVLAFEISSLWFLISFVMFYILYGIEFLIKLPFYGSDTYRNVSFEREAYDNEKDDSYIENSGYFEWFKYILKKNK